MTKAKLCGVAIVAGLALMVAVLLAPSAFAQGANPAATTAPVPVAVAGAPAEMVIQSLLNNTTQIVAPAVGIITNLVVAVAGALAGGVANGFLASGFSADPSAAAAFVASARQMALSGADAAVNDSLAFGGAVGNVFSSLPPLVGGF